VLANAGTTLPGSGTTPWIGRRGTFSSQSGWSRLLCRLSGSKAVLRTALALHENEIVPGTSGRPRNDSRLRPGSCRQARAFAEISKYRRLRHGEDGEAFAIEIIARLDAIVSAGARAAADATDAAGEPRQAKPSQSCPTARLRWAIPEILATFLKAQNGSTHPSRTACPHWGECRLPHVRIPGSGVHAPIHDSNR